MKPTAPASPIDSTRIKWKDFMQMDEFHQMRKLLRPRGMRLRVKLDANKVCTDVFVEKVEEPIV